MTYLTRLTDLGCLLCRHLGHRGTPAEVHHRRMGMGLSVRATDDEAIPLCVFHHRGTGGIHGMGRKRFERYYKITELELLAWTKRLLEVA